MTVVVLTPHGFCAGVAGALEKARRLAEGHDAGDGPVCCLHEIVHNELVVADLKARGFVFVERIDDMPEGATVLFSAHGVSPAVRAAARARKLRVVDATCPFVERVHRAARDFAARDLPVVVIGNPSHVEVKGIVGEVEEVGGRVAVISSVAEIDSLPSALGLQSSVSTPTLGVVSQTTMNADEVALIVAALKTRYAVETTAEVCHATKVRQDAVKAFRGDALLVLGSVASSNTRRLCEVAPCRTFRAGTLDEVKALDLTGVRTLGITAGASTPEDFIAAAVTAIS